MLYVSMPLDTFSMNSPLRSTARLHAYSTTSTRHGRTHVQQLAAPVPGTIAHGMNAVDKTHLSAFDNAVKSMPHPGL